MDLVSTIEECMEVHNFSEESESEIEYQPTKSRKERNEFVNEFYFISAKDYNKDSWGDLMQHVHCKSFDKADCKTEGFSTITKNEIILEKEDFVFSDDELKHDFLRSKEKKKRKRKAATNELVNEEDMIFDNIQNCNLLTSFHQMNLSRPILKAIGALGYIHPTPIQASTIPIALLGRDIYGCAATGTGKTAAFMLPTIERLLYKPINNKTVTRVLVLVPTRELGAQVYQVAKQLCQFTSIDVGLAIGGLDLKTQETVLRQNPDIVIATPGRLIDHIKNTPSFSLLSIEVLVLDEADRMLDAYFSEQMKEIIASCSKTRQTMLFSATMSEEVEDLAAVSLEKPVKIFMNNNQTVAFNLRQEFIRVRNDKEADRESILASLICRTFHENCMVFVQTKKQAHRLHILLKLLGVRTGELHGNLTQQQRLESLKKFKKNEIDVLIATDVAARGLDIIGVKTVINFVMPISTEHYIHRVGRTARAGRAGLSVSLAGEKERKVVKDIIKNTNSTVKNRVVPLEVIAKYRMKLTSLEPEIERVLNEERVERELAKTQQQMSKVEQKLFNTSKEQRNWFQSREQREAEKKSLSINIQPKSVGCKREVIIQNVKKEQTLNKKNRRKSKKYTPEQLAKERVMREIENVMTIRAKYGKLCDRPTRLNSVSSLSNSCNRKTKNHGEAKKHSSFTTDLTDVGRIGAVRIRSEGNRQKKIETKNKIRKLNKGNTK